MSFKLYLFIFSYWLALQNMHNMVLVHTMSAHRGTALGQSTGIKHQLHYDSSTVIWVGSSQHSRHNFFSVYQTVMCRMQNLIRRRDFLLPRKYQALGFSEPSMFCSNPTAEAVYGGLDIWSVRMGETGCHVVGLERLRLLVPRGEVGAGWHGLSV